MIYLIYVVLAVAVVIVSDKAGKYVDLLDKKTSLSGAFIGGVMLSAVTSLPELFTSISATLFLDKPELCMGNILGSDLFNLQILAVLMIVYFKSFAKASVAKSHIFVSLSVILIYISLALNMLGIVSFDIIPGFRIVSVTSIIIIILYTLGIKQMANENQDEDDSEDDSPLTLKQVITRFILTSIGIIAISIALTYATDEIATRLHLGEGLAGAIFLGIATSLPELASTVALFRIKNYNIAIGNIIGSNIFNFIILAVADLVYFGSHSVYDFSDPKNINLLVFGLASMLIFVFMAKFKNKATQIFCSLGMLACYFAFLLVPNITQLF